MRYALFVVAFVGCMALSARAYETVTAAQLENKVSRLKTESDLECAHRISRLRLSERLSDPRGAALEVSVSGDRCRQALLALADESQFQAPPASEIPPQPAPDLATQRAIIGRVVEYVSKTIPRLPDFLATRQTMRFEDMPQRKADYANQYEPLHPVGSATEQVSYADGREVAGSGTKPGNQAESERGLSTWGEFGPILSTVLLDAARNKLGWLRWEGSDSGPLAVFGYSVPRENSHYEVDYCCVQDSESRPRVFHELEGYQGEISADPATGAILRLTLRAQIKSGEPVSRADLLVEYAPVDIGGKSYTCPLRSIAVSRAQSLSQEKVEAIQAGPHGAGGAALVPVLTGSAGDGTEQTLLNESTFAQYHVFRAESRILTAAESPLPLPGASPAQVAGPEAAQPTEADVPAGPVAGREPAARAPAAMSSEIALSPAPLSASELSLAPEMTETAAPSLSNLPNIRQASSVQTGFTLRAIARLVDVAVVAFDRKGRLVTDLNPTDLEIYDNGARQQIKFFSQAELGAVQAAPTSLANETAQGQAPASAPLTASNRGTPASTPADNSGNTAILLIDAGNLAFSDLSYARGEMLRFLKAVPADEQVGLYVFGGHGFKVLQEPTTDHAKLAATLSAWVPSAQDLLRAQEEEFRNRQQMEYVLHATDLLLVNGNTPTGYQDSVFPVDPQLRSEGSRPVADALFLLLGVARHLAVLPGHKSLIWVSSDNLLADFSEKAPHGERGDKYTDALAMNAREALNEAHISIYPLDASQLEAGGVSAGLANANVRVSPTDSSLEAILLPKGQRQEVIDAEAKSRRDINPGRVTATLQQDTHPIQETFVQLAQATGGRTLRRAGDIAAELNSIVADGRAGYLLSFTPDTPADGKYHVLTVKTTRPGVTLRHRNGYLYSEEPATMKDRFHEAVWQPRDENEIGLKAVTVKKASGAALRLNIACTDLQPVQENGRWTDKVDIFMVTRDDSDLNAVVMGRRLGLALLPATYQRYMKDGLTLEESLPNIPTGALLRLVVIDENSGRLGSITVGGWSRSQEGLSPN
ncbi:MAG TPA: VWA domain-containing protein [Terracidiphilus sp.]|jgi:VWFA-related protein|nr:VWA domain-containing protein [Terracidiphilus sp.]